MIICLDVETTKFPCALPWIDGSQLVSVHAARSDGTTSTWFVDNYTQRQLVSIIQDEVNSAEKVVGHNFKFDYEWLTNIGVEFDKLYCTQVAEYVLKCFPALRGLSLNDLCKTYDLPTKLDKVKQYWDSGYDTQDIPRDILQEYGEQDCKLTLAIYFKQLDLIRSREQATLLSLEMESLKAFATAEMNGMLLNVELLKEYSEHYKQKIATIDNRLMQIVGDPTINLNSPAQLSAVLYGGTFSVDGRVPGKREGTMKNGKVDKTIKGLGIKPLPNTETEVGYSTDAPTIMQLKPRTKAGKEFIELWQERAKLNTMNKTFFNGLLERQVDSMVHPTINQTITSTSRTSCSNPNGQNLPRGNTGPVKKAFITRY